MELAARRFIRFVLILHFVLLVGVVLIVGIAARQVRRNAYSQAMDQAKDTQELLAKQTARGVENYYKAVTSVLELLKPTQEEEPGTTQPATPGAAALGGGGVPLAVLAPASPSESPGPAARPALGARALGAARFAEAVAMRKRLIEALWRDSQQRVSLMFALDLVKPTPRSTIAPATSQNAALRLVVHDAFGEENGLTAQAVVDQLAEWFRQVDSPTVSSFQVIDGVRCNVVAVPMRQAGRRVLVAVVPVDRIERDLLANVNARATTGAMLVDEQGTVMSHSRPEVIGSNVRTDFRSGHARQVASQYMLGDVGGTEVFDQPTFVGGVRLDPGMVTIEPIEFPQFPGKRWWISIASGLANIDAVVNTLFREAATWAVFVILAVSAILFSTSIQLIRGRMRLERLRHELLERELSQAREIQLNWLPHEPLVNNAIDVAAINRPASRISGDFYNWFQLPDGRIVLAIGDVTGHGMAAAFLMATTQLLIRSSMLRIGDPGRCLEDVNRQLCMQIFNGQFVTMVLAVLDLDHQTIDLATAGHPAPLIGADDGFHQVEIEPQLVLGVDREALFPTQRLTLPKGSCLLLYTDGVVDATNTSGKRFQLSGLLSSLSANSFSNAQAILDAITSRVDDFRHSQDLSDDLTLVAIQLQPAAIAASLVGAG